MCIWTLFLNDNQSRADESELDKGSMNINLSSLATARLGSDSTEAVSTPLDGLKFRVQTWPGLYFP